MTKQDIPNKSGDYMVDGVSIIVLPDKIKIDTGGKGKTSAAYKQGHVTGGYPVKKKKKTAGKSNGDKKKDRDDGTLGAGSEMFAACREFTFNGLGGDKKKR